MKNQLNRDYVSQGKYFLGEYKGGRKGKPMKPNIKIMLENYAETTVAMDDDLRAHVSKHFTFAGPEKFVKAMFIETYCRAHKAKYGKEFTV